MRGFDIASQPARSPAIIQRCTFEPGYSRLQGVHRFDDLELSNGGEIVQLAGGHNFNLKLLNLRACGPACRRHYQGQWRRHEHARGTCQGKVQTTRDMGTAASATQWAQEQVQPAHNGGSTSAAPPVILLAS